MFVKKKSICELEKCYSIAPFQQNGEPRFLVAAEKHAPCYEDIEINDRVGGGDSFASGLIWGMLEGHDDQQVLDFATAYSALCHTIRNDWDLVTREEAQALANGGSARVKR